MGWSVIPLWGDRQPERGKTPALMRWQAYQKRLPTAEDLHQWFQTDGFTAAGIVLGHVSKLVVIDIDDAHIAEQFAQALPDLTCTFTVRSGYRGLPHYYFRLPDDLHVSGRTASGFELRANGQYVVAPGSRVQSNTWTVTHDVEPLTLSERDLRRVLAFMRTIQQKNQENRSQALAEANTPMPDYDLTPTQIIKRYKLLAVQRGRNNALFQVGCDVRDVGWSYDKAVSLFSVVHVQQHPIGVHRNETPRQRQQEAVRTLQSVYKRPARKFEGNLDTTPIKQLPNTVREKLLALGLVNLARLLDALLRSDVVPGQHLTAKDVYAQVKVFGIGRNTVYNMLKSVDASGKPIFAPSPHTPHPQDANAAKRCAMQTKQCLFGRDSNPGKNKSRGRPQVAFTMPDIAQICEQLHVKDRGNDPISDAALRSPAAYRAALHAALIRRSPGKYPRRWQAKRLHVSVATCKRYDKRMNIFVRPTYKAYSVHWHTVDSLLCDDADMGCFLLDAQGKRYPPTPTIARMLLSHNQTVTYMIQDANLYSTEPLTGYDAGRFAADFAQVQSEVAKLASNQELQAPWSVDYKAQQTRLIPPQSTLSPPLKEPDLRLQNVPPAPQAKSMQMPSDHVVDYGCVDLLHKTLRKLNRDHAMTRQKAHQVVEKYGDHLVRKGLKVLLSRKGVRNPAGFILTWLRSESTQSKEFLSVLNQNVMG